MSKLSLQIVLNSASMFLQALVKALEVAQENFKGFERKDAQLNMELGHVKQKLRKTEAKIESDAGNMNVGNSDRLGLYR